MNVQQQTRFAELLDRFNCEFRIRDEHLEFHHGNCDGVDAQAAEIAKYLGIKTVAHPGRAADGNTDLTSDFVSDETRETFTHFKRNRNIVDEVGFLFVIPRENTPQSKGGTWYTYDYAMKHGKALTVIYPN
jgi:hypothetical protein